MSEWFGLGDGKVAFGRMLWYGMIRQYVDKPDSRMIVKGNGM